MFVNSKSAEEKAILDAACSICAAARTAPKACGIDKLETAILIGEDKDALAEEMRAIKPGSFFSRDADNVDASGAVVLIGTSGGTRGLNELCGLCHHENCAACEAADGCCEFNAIDLGIAVGSAVARAADLRIDNRVMFTIGKAAASLGLLGEHKLIMGIPLAVSGKSPYYDRK